MDVHTRFERAMAEWNLLNHPFYRAWSQGTLPREVLRTYAREYGAFVALLPQGWNAVGDLKTAAEERDHIALWECFARALQSDDGPPRVPEVKTLLGVASRHFEDPVSALGALYAFEVQQPATAASKLAGLQAHYAMDQSSQRYFEVHSANHHEAVKLGDRIDGLDEQGQDRALAACREVGRALWDALSGIHGAGHPAEGRAP